MRTRVRARKINLNQEIFGKISVLAKTIRPLKTRESSERFIKKGTTIFATITPFTTIPQLTTIWVDKNVSGISSVLWITFLLNSSFWFFYGFLNRDKIVYISNLVWVLIDTLILVGLFTYN